MQPRLANCTLVVEWTALDCLEVVVLIRIKHVALMQPNIHIAGPVDAAGFMDARMLGDTGVAILGSGEGIVYGVNVSNPSEVKVSRQGHCSMAEDYYLCPHIWNWARQCSLWVADMGISEVCVRN